MKEGAPNSPTDSVPHNLKQRERQANTMDRTPTKPELPAYRIAGYSAMAAPLMSMLEQSEYHDPAGVADFRERVNRIIPAKPGFLQLADWFLAKHGAIKVHTSAKTGKMVMSDGQQVLDWKDFVMKHHSELKLHKSDDYGFYDDQSADREGHIEEMVQGSQHLFAYRAADLSIGVTFGASASGFKREFDSQGNEIPGSRKDWSARG